MTEVKPAIRQIIPTSDEEIAQILKHADEHCPLDEEVHFCEDFGCSSVRELIARITQDRATIERLTRERDEALKRVGYLEALLIVAATGHDKDWDDPDTDPEDCSQCKYEGMREALREGRDIIAARKEGK